MDVYAKIFFFFTVHIYSVGWFGMAPCVNIYNNNLSVEQKHSPLQTVHTRCIFWQWSRFKQHRMLVHSEGYWVQILPKETPLSVVDEKKMTFTQSSPPSQNWAIIATALECPLLLMASKIFACKVLGAFWLGTYNWFGFSSLHTLPLRHANKVQFITVMVLLITDYGAAPLTMEQE